MKKVWTVTALFVVLVLAAAVAASAVEPTQGNWRFFLKPDDGNGMYSAGSMTIGVNTATSTKDGFGVDGTASDGKDLYADSGFWQVPNVVAFALGVFNNKLWCNDVESTRVPQSAAYYPPNSIQTTSDPAVTFGTYPYEAGRKLWDLRVGGLGGFTGDEIRLQFFTVAAAAGFPPATLPKMDGSGSAPAAYWLRMLDNRGVSGAPANGTTWSIPIPTAHSSVAYYSLTLPTLKITLKDEAHAISEGYGMQFYQTQTIPEPSGLLALLCGIGALGGMMWRRKRFSPRALLFSMRKVLGPAGFCVLPAAVIAVLCLGVCAQADVFNLGAGFTNLETVTVGDAGNAADTRIMSDGTTGYGSVGYTYNIGKYEVTCGQYTAFLNAVAATDTYGLYNENGITRSGAPGGYTYSVASDFMNRPVNYVSWGDCARFVNWLNNGQPTGAQDLSTTEDGAYYLNGATTDAALIAVTRKAGCRWAITSEDEWYKAAYYKGGSTSAGYWLYPTRSNTAPGRNMADPSGNNANYHNTAPGPPSGPFPIDSGKWTTVVGEFQNSPGPYGTFDQGGNVWEWNEAIVSGVARGFRGGWLGADYFRLAAWDRCDFYPTNEGFDMGFRVSEVPEPSGLLALAGGTAGLAGLGLKRRK